MNTDRTFAGIEGVCYVSDSPSTRLSNQSFVKSLSYISASTISGRVCLLCMATVSIRDDSNALAGLTQTKTSMLVLSFD